MDREKIKLVLYFVIGLLATFLVMYYINDGNSNKTLKENQASVVNQGYRNEVSAIDGKKKSGSQNLNIDELTNEKSVISYVKSHHRLPDFYMSKSDARKKGWIAAKGNLCDVLSGKAIGGDKFSNREKILPDGENYFEADVNYNCGNRNADRIVFTKNGEVWLTKNHYKSFEKQ